MTAPDSFFGLDYETFGRDPRRDRPAQFAGVRTDADLNEIEPPVTWYCRPAPDTLPDPGSVLVTGIVPQLCLERGLVEAEFARRIEAELSRPGTVGAGYNSIRFDDEFTRFLFWRNLIDPYAREWRDGCGRWDLLDVVRCCWALRPEGLQWPVRDDGRASFRLEDLTRANGLAHESAHDALSDVQATLALARLVRERKRALWDFCLRLRHKDAVRAELDQGRPLVHVSGRYPVERGCLALVWPLATHPVNRNEVILWDLAHDPGVLEGLDAQAVRERLFVGEAQRPEGVQRLPIKTLHLNRAPVVIAHERIVRDAAERWRVDLADVERHARRAQALAPALSGLWADVYRPPDDGTAVDVDLDLYGGFLGDADRRRLQRVHETSPERLAHASPAFDDPRLEELLFRFRARNHPQTLSPAEQSRWRRHCAERLHLGAAGCMTLADFQARVDELADGADERGQALLEQLLDYAESIAPEPGDAS